MAGQLIERAAQVRAGAEKVIGGPAGLMLPAGVRALILELTRVVEAMAQTIEQK